MIAFCCPLRTPPRNLWRVTSASAYWKSYAGNTATSLACSGWKSRKTSASRQPSNAGRIEKPAQKTRTSGKKKGFRVMISAISSVQTVVLSCQGIGELGMFSLLIRLFYETVDLIFGNRAPTFSKDGPPEYQQVLKSVSDALVKDPSNIEAHFPRGFVYRCKGLYAQALSDFREVIRLQPKHAHAWLLSSEVLFHLREYGQANAARRKALELDPACEHIPIRLSGMK